MTILHEYWDHDQRLQDQQPLHSAFYRHPYGGIARDIHVTRIQFARFFGVSVEYVDSVEFNMKCLDDNFPGGETLGYKIKTWEWRDGHKLSQISYRITVITYDYARIAKILDIYWEQYGIRTPFSNSQN
jgi:hypothetical protein